MTAVSKYGLCIDSSTLLVLFFLPALDVSFIIMNFDARDVLVD